MNDQLPLEGLTVLDFSQYYAGPSAALRLADLGAKVIKVERPDVGDMNRQLKLKKMVVEDDSLLFHIINRNKLSYAANLKDPDDLQKVKKLISRADILIQNFRPGIMEKLGLDYETVSLLNPRLIYASITGYGTKGPWKDLPGQDLLVQARSGVGYLHGKESDEPLPTSIAAADAFTGCHLVQGILALVIRRFRTGKGGKVDGSLMESMIDAQFEMFATYLRDKELPGRCEVNGGHIYNAAPYGFYRTKNGFIALAMGSIKAIAEALEVDDLEAYYAEDAKFDHRSDIKRILVRHLREKTTEEWLEKLNPAGIWCAEVNNWEELVHSEGFKSLDMLLNIKRPSGAEFTTVRCPIRIDDKVLKNGKWAPKIGEDNDRLDRELNLDA